ncbi:hypothetical protein GCM10027614_58580 [Micromonospora vulcania]
MPRVRGTDPRCERLLMSDDAPALDLLALLPEQWRAVLTPHLDQARTAALAEFVAREYATQTVFPPLTDLFSAYRLCPPQSTRVLILGQDPYHKAGQAHGLSFSVRDGVPVPPSLRNVFKELGEDVGVPKPRSGNLDGWAAQGVLLLNAVLTVRQATPAHTPTPVGRSSPTPPSEPWTRRRSGWSSCSGAATPARRPLWSPTHSTWCWRPATRAR